MTYLPKHYEEQNWIFGVLELGAKFVNQGDIFFCE
jgi:hypothetical protein